MSPPLLFIFLGIATTVLADLQCFPPPPANLENIQYMVPRPPPPGDCLAIAAQIPLLLELPAAEAHHLPPTLPFFPRAYFIHGECTVRISYSSEQAPSANIHLSSASLDTIYDRQEQTPVAPLSVTSIASIWRAAKLAVIEVTAQCLSHDWAGIKWDFVNVAEIPGAWYLVEVAGTDPGSRSWLRKNMRKERRALRGIDPALVASSDLMRDNKFKMTIWKVP